MNSSHSYDNKKNHRRLLIVATVIACLILIFWGWIQWLQHFIDPPQGFVYGERQQAQRLAQIPPVSKEGAIHDLKLTGKVLFPASNNQQRGASIVTLKQLNTPSEIRTTRYSTKNGDFHFNNLGEGDYSIHARDNSFMSAVQHIHLTANKMPPVTLVLDKPDPEPYPATFYASKIDFPNEEMRADFREQCSYCHAIGNPRTRLHRSADEWRALIQRMKGMGAVLKRETEQALPDILSTSLDGKAKAGLKMPALASAVLTATIIEGSLGVTDSAYMHDLAVADNQWLYTVDMSFDRIFAFNMQTGQLDVWRIPQRGNARGGFLRTAARALGTMAAYQGPHSVEYGPDQRLWITNALGNEIMAFDLQNNKTQHWSLPRGGFYPHTLRVTPNDIWFTVAMSNHLGHLDLKANTIHLIDLPRTTWEQQVGMGLLGTALALAARNPNPDSQLNYSLSNITGNGASFLPLPYGIDLAPDGTVWYSKLYANRIGHYDPKTKQMKEWETPFRGPRRLDVAADGTVWIPGFVAGILASFDPNTEKFSIYPLPSVPEDADLPYAVKVHPDDGHVWVASTAMDVLYRFNPQQKTFLTYPLPTRSAYLRELEVMENGIICGSYAHLPREHMPDSSPSFVCIDP